MFKVYEFHWQAENRFQQKHKGKLLAPNREEAEIKLTAKGYQHIQLKRNFTISTKPKFEEITQWLNQLALLTNAAIPLKSALKMLLDNCYQIQLYHWTYHIIQTIEKGFSFSAAIQEQGLYLNHQEIQLIQMAEKSGNLGIILNNLSHSREKSEKLSKKVKKILFYPIIVLFISITLSLMLLIFIVPQFAALYQSKDKSLPLITKILFHFSAFLTSQSEWITFILLIISILLIFIARKTTYITQFKYLILSHTPILSQIAQYARLIFFSQNIALMLHSHIRLDVILNSFLSEKATDLILQREVKFILSLINQGYRFSEGLNPTIFDSQAIQMIAMGEKSGRLVEMLDYVTEVYQQKLDYQIDILSQLLEPMLMLILGAIVGTMIVGLYLPIFDIGAMVG